VEYVPYLVAQCIEKHGYLSNNFSRVTSICCSRSRMKMEFSARWKVRKYLRGKKSNLRWKQL